MTHDVWYSPSSIADLKEIEEYILATLGSPQAASNVVQNILDAIDTLALFPLSGATVKLDYVPIGEYRYVIAGNYMAFYHIESDSVRVDRILYAKSNYLTTLFETDEPQTEE